AQMHHVAMNNLGAGPHEMGVTLPAVSFGPGRTPLAVAAGPSESCALLNGSVLTCSGAKGLGQRGLGDTSSWGDGPSEMGAALATVALGTGRSALSVGVGGDPACAT